MISWGGFFRKIVRHRHFWAGITALILIVAVLGTYFSLFVSAGTNIWYQSSWVGGAAPGLYATHSANLTNWTKYESVTAGVSVANNVVDYSSGTVLCAGATIMPSTWTISSNTSLNAGTYCTSANGTGVFTVNSGITLTINGAVKIISETMNIVGIINGSGTITTSTGTNGGSGGTGTRQDFDGPPWFIVTGGGGGGGGGGAGSGSGGSGGGAGQNGSSGGGGVMSGNATDKTFPTGNRGNSGGNGGNGTTNNSGTPQGGSGGGGGNGGAAVYLLGQTLNISGSIKMNGVNGSGGASGGASTECSNTAAAGGGGGGGGGSGGTVLLEGKDIVLSGTVEALNGSGGSGGGGGACSGKSGGAGGPGVKGRIKVFYESAAPACPATANATSVNCIAQTSTFSPDATLVSSWFTSEDAAVVYSSISWAQFNGKVRIQVRAASDLSGSPNVAGATAYVGPSGTTADYFESTNPSCTTQNSIIISCALPNSALNPSSTRPWAQYKVEFLPNINLPDLTSVDDVKLTYVVNTVPSVTGPTASQDQVGAVNVGFSISDPEGDAQNIRLFYDPGATLASSPAANSTSVTLSSASYFPNAGTILLDKEMISYTSKSGNVLQGTFTRGANNTLAAAHSSGATVWLMANAVTGNAGSGQAVGTGKTIAWTAKTDLVNFYSTSARVLVSANDGQIANQVGNSSPVTLTIDTIKPVLTTTGHSSYTGLTILDTNSAESPTAAMLTTGTAATAVGAFSAGQAVDGSGVTKGWDTNTTAANAWVRADLGLNNDKDYVRARLNMSGANYTGVYSVQYSDNNSAWTSASTGWIPNASGWNERTWSNLGRHRYWRLLLTNTPGSGPTVQEVEFLVTTLANASVKFERTNQQSVTANYAATDNSTIKVFTQDITAAGFAPPACSSGSYVAINQTFDAKAFSLLNATNQTKSVKSRVCDAKGNFTDTATYTTVFDTTPPAVPTNLALQENSSAGVFRIFLSWSPVSDPSSDFLQYNIQRSTDNVNFAYIPCPQGSLTATNKNICTDDTVSNGTVYYYRVNSEDLSNNQSAFTAALQLTAGGPPVDNTPVVVSNLVANATGTHTATVTWDTNKAGDSRVYYATTAAALNTVSDATAHLDDSTFVLNGHSVKLYGLTANTTYFVKARSIDANATAGYLSAQGANATVSFLTSNVDITAPAFTVAPAINGTQRKRVSFGYTLNASPGGPGITLVDIGSDTNYTLGTFGSYNVVSGSQTYHLPLFLTPETAYNARMRSRDDAGNPVTGANISFSTTATNNDDTPATFTVGPSAGTPGANNATITWTNNESTTFPIVEYGTTTNYGSVAYLRDSYATAKSVALPSHLIGSTLYHYRARAYDVMGNESISPDLTFTTAAAGAPTTPTITSIATVSDALPNTARITWTTTGVNSDSTVLYSQDNSYSLSAYNPAFVTSHTVTLTNLEAGQVYNFKVQSKSVFNNTATSAVQTLATAPNANAALSINSVNVPPVPSITPNSAVVNWTTSENANSFVEYGFDQSYGLLQGKEDSVTSHSITLVGLVPLMNYHLRVRSQTADGREAVSQNINFNTPTKADTTAPVITAVTSSNPTLTGATITWTTDENSDSVVEFGTSGGFGQVTAQFADSTLSHSLGLSNLTQNTQYFYRVKSKDAAGNTRTDDNRGVAYWPLSEGLGLATADATGGGNNGTINGATWTASGKYGSALSFNGSSDYVDVPDSSALNNNGAISVSAWVKVGAYVNFTRIVSKQDDAGLGYMLLLQNNNSGVGFVVRNSAGTEFNRYGGSVNDGLWHHVVGTFDQNDRVKLYIDGALNGQSGVFSGSPSVTSNPLRIGSRSNNTSYFNGTIDDVRIYNRALTATEISNEYNNVNAYLFTTTADTVKPIITNLVVSNIVQTGATVTWTTDKASTSQVEYALDAAFTTPTAVPSPADTEKVLSHSVVLSSLTANTLYYVRAKSSDAAGNAATMVSTSFTTAAAPDTTPPNISNIVPADGATVADQTQATITWDTNEPADSKVIYGTASGSLTLTKADTAMVTPPTAHSLTLTGLTQNTTYYYRIISKDAAANTATFPNPPAAPRSFKTAADTVAPTLTVTTAVTNITTTGATVTWTTSKATSTQVKYGTSPTLASGNLFAPSPADSALVLSHSVNLSSLTPNTQYYAQALSVDAAGNSLASSPIVPFSTLAVADTTPPTITVAVNVAPTQNTATVTWTTNEAATSIVKYGTTSNLGTLGGDTQLTTGHTVVLTGLTPGTQYHYRVETADAAGNITNSPITANPPATFNTVADTTAPVISNLAVSNKTQTGATITWTTDEASTSQVEYATNAQFTSSLSTTENTEKVVSHTVVLGNLTANTLYYIRAKSKDASNNAATPATTNFTTLATPDTTPPVISVVTATNISLTGATITWTTNEVADSIVEYGLTTALGTTAGSTTESVTSHSVALTGLNSGVTYYYLVRSKDPAGNQATADNGGLKYQFVTTADTTPPVISAIQVTGIGQTQATITWTTNEPATRQVEIGTAANLAGANSTTEVTALSTSHSVTVTGLTLNTLYYYRVKSKDASNNLAQSAIASFSTIVGVDTTGPVITNVAANVTGLTTATITWTTDENASHFVSYGPTVGLGFVEGSASASTLSHTVNLVNLVGGTQYYYQVQSTDSFGNLTTDDNATNFYNFTTSADSTAPVITGVTEANIGETVVTIAWTTDEPATTQVEYSLNANLTSSTLSTIINDPILTHSVTVSGLTNDTTYYYRVRSKDFAVVPNEGVGTIRNFRTNLTPDSTPPVISNVRIANLSEHAVDVLWDTNEPTNAFLEYESGNILTSNKSSVGLETTALTAHTISLTNLLANTTYTYQVYSRDAAGFLSTKNADDEGTIFRFSTVADTLAPVISNLTIGNISQTSATITWNTDEDATARISYGLGATTLDQTTATASALQKFHTRTIGELTAGTTYYFNIHSKDSADNEATLAAPLTFTTLPTEIVTTTVGGVVFIQASGSGDGKATDNTPPLITNVRVLEIRDKEAAITWNTDEPADSLVSYGTSTAYTDSRGARDTITAHRVLVNRLQPSTKYFYEITARDAAGNLGKLAGEPFTTLAGQADSDETGANEITNLRVLAITKNSAIVTWSTSSAADGQVNYGLTSLYGSKTPVMPDKVKDHSVQLTGLSAGVTYHYQVVSVTATGKMATSPDGSFTTLSDGAVNIPPILAKGPVVDNITNNSATIAWITDRPANSIVLFKRTGGLLSKVAPFQEVGSFTESTPDHQISLINLQPDALYQFKIKSIDAQGNALESEVKTFRTAAQSAIKNISVTEITFNSAVITWETAEPSSTVIDFGKTEAYGDSLNVSELARAHRTKLENLAPGTTYHFRVQGSDSQGNPLSSSDITFVTLGPPQITNHQVIDISGTEVQIIWSTDKPTQGSIEYENATTKERLEKGAPGLASDHIINLTGLKINTTYTYTIVLKDLSGNVTRSKQFSFVTGQDNTPPEILQVRTDNAISPKGDRIQTIITWKTSEPAIGLVEYQDATDPASEPVMVKLDDELSNNHVAVLTNFRPGKVYRFKIHSSDAAGNKVVSKEFTTLTPRQQESVVDVIFKTFENSFGFLKKLQ